MKYIVDEKNSGRQIKYILSGELGFSSGFIKKLKEAEGIKVNGECVKVIERAREGDEIEIVFPRESSKNIIPEKMELDILYEDEDIIALNKPSAMVTHPVSEIITGTLANGVLGYFDGKFTVRVITRLDKDTTGVVLIAKNAVAARNLNEQMKKGQIEKEYVAIVLGKTEMMGRIDAKIARGEGIKRVVSDEGKSAVTEYEVIEYKDELTFLKLKPVTGRTHQIRVHLSFIGHPIYADWLYGGKGDGRCRLHCRKIKFTHPVSGERKEIEAQIPEDILKFFQ